MDAGSLNYWSPPGGDDFRDVTSLLVAASAGGLLVLLSQI